MVAAGRPSRAEIRGDVKHPADKFSSVPHDAGPFRQRLSRASFTSIGPAQNASLATVLEVMANDLVLECFACDQQAATFLPPREDVARTDHWRVAHAFNSTLPGWLVLLPTHHITSFTELSPEAADELGGLIRRLGVALEAVTGCVKTYLVQFSEAEGFSHLHLHLVPRLPNHPEEARGPRVFVYLTDDEARWLPAAERDAVAMSIRAALA